MTISVSAEQLDKWRRSGYITYTESDAAFTQKLMEAMMAPIETPSGEDHEISMLWQDLING